MYFKKEETYKKQLDTKMFHVYNININKYKKSSTLINLIGVKFISRN